MDTVAGDGVDSVVTVKISIPFHYILHVFKLSLFLAFILLALFISTPLSLSFYVSECCCVTALR